MRTMPPTPSTSRRVEISSGKTRLPPKSPPYRTRTTGPPAPPPRKPAIHKRCCLPIHRDFLMPSFHPHFCFLLFNFYISYVPAIMRFFPKNAIFYCVVRLRLRCSFRKTFTVNRDELRQRKTLYESLISEQRN